MTCNVGEPSSNEFTTNAAVAGSSTSAVVGGSGSTSVAEAEVTTGEGSTEATSSPDPKNDDSDESSSSGQGPETTTGGLAFPEASSSSTGSPAAVVEPTLWYAVEDRLIRITIDQHDGSVSDVAPITMTTTLVDGQNGLTMLDDGSLVGSRESVDGTQLYHVPSPPTGESSIEITILGNLPGALRIEALYTDCQGAVYLMDTGEDTTSALGNRLLRFTGDFLAGEFDNEVITDLSVASVADIDDMGPGITAEKEITDALGFAIDTGTIYAFDYNVGNGTFVGRAGTWGIHALGGSLFHDGEPRLYVLDSDARLFEVNASTFEVSASLVRGPQPAGDAEPGWSGLTGPLTECQTSFPPVPQ